MDPERKYCLTKFASKTGVKTYSKESDHNTLIVQLNQEWNTKLKDNGPRQEILNFKNKDDFEMFVKLTNESEELRNSF